MDAVCLLADRLELQILKRMKMGFYSLACILKEDPVTGSSCVFESRKEGGYVMSMDGSVALGYEERKR